MIFSGITALVGIILFTGTIFLSRKISAKYKFSRKIFWKAGFYLILIELFHLTVLGNAFSIWPWLTNLSRIEKSLIFGIMSGLFFELGKFLVLDRSFKKLRSYNEGIYFGLGWEGVVTILTGILLFISAFGMQYLISTPDLAAVFPNASTQEVAQLQTYQQQAKDLLNGNQLLALSPLLERGSAMLVEIALSLLIILGLIKGEFKYVWIAVSVKFIFESFLHYFSGINLVYAEIIFAIFALLGILAIKKLKYLFPVNLRN